MMETKARPQRISPRQLQMQLKELGIDRTYVTVCRMCRVGMVPAIKIGGNWEIEADAIERLMGRK